VITMTQSSTSVDGHGRAAIWYWRNVAINPELEAVA
jgi:hypothetical protein